MRKTGRRPDQISHSSNSVIQARNVVGGQEERPTDFARLDALPVECDGLTRVISSLMVRDGVRHSVQIGRLDVEGFGAVAPHWWIELPDGRIVDFRVRCWLGAHERLPHGVFAPTPSQRYQSLQEGVPRDAAFPPVVFHVLLMEPMEAFGSVAGLFDHRDPRHTPLASGKA